MTETIPRNGPFDNEASARLAAASTGLGNHDMLTAACVGAGVQLGEHDARIVRWLGIWESSTIIVIVGLIARAFQAGQEITSSSRLASSPGTPQLTPEQRITILDALEVAAENKRDLVDICSDCDGGTCAACEHRLAVADQYDAVARELGGGGQDPARAPVRRAGDDHRPGGCRIARVVRGVLPWPVRVGA